jgi:hypothetical protein
MVRQKDSPPCKKGTMETWKHIRTAAKLFSSWAVLYLLIGAAVAYGILFTFGLLAGPLIGSFVNLGLVHLRTGKPPGLGDVISGFQNLGHLLLLSLLLVACGLGLGVILPVMMAFVWWAYIPLLVLLVSLVTWWMYVPALIVDRHMSILRAMGESRTRVTNRGGFFPHLGFVVCVFVLPPLAIFGLSAVFPFVSLLNFVVCPFQFLALASAYEEESVA